MDNRKTVQIPYVTWRVAWPHCSDVSSTMNFMQCCKQQSSQPFEGQEEENHPGSFRVVCTKWQNFDDSWFAAPLDEVSRILEIVIQYHAGMQGNCYTLNDQGQTKVSKVYPYFCKAFSLALAFDFSIRSGHLEGIQ